VEFQQVLADIEIARLDLLLRLLERLVDPGMNDRLVLLQSELLQHSIELVGSEDAHQVVFQGEEELGMTWIALATRAAAQLIVNATALVAPGAKNIEPTRSGRLFL